MPGYIGNFNEDDPYNFNNSYNNRNDALRRLGAL